MGGRLLLPALAGGEKATGGGHHLIRILANDLRWHLIAQVGIEPYEPGPHDFRRLFLKKEICDPKRLAKAAFVLSMWRPFAASPLADRSGVLHAGNHSGNTLSEQIL